MTVGRRRVSDRDAIVYRVRWCAAVRTPINCHCELEQYSVENVVPVKFIMQHLTKAAFKRLSTSDNTRSSVEHTMELFCYYPVCTSKNGVTVGLINPRVDKGVGHGRPSQLLLSSYYKSSSVAEMDRLATIDIGRKLGAVPLFGKAGSPLTSCGLGRGLPPYQVAS